MHSPVVSDPRAQKQSSASLLWYISMSVSHVKNSHFAWKESNMEGFLEGGGINLHLGKLNVNAFQSLRWQETKHKVCWKVLRSRGTRWGTDTDIERHRNRSRDFMTSAGPWQMDSFPPVDRHERNGQSPRQSSQAHQWRCWEAGAWTVGEKP